MNKITNNVSSYTPTFSSFKNFSKLFSFRAFAILVATLVLSFSVRCLVILFFNLGLSQFLDFFFVGLLVTYIRVLVADLFEFYLSKDNLTPHVLRQYRNSHYLPVGSTSQGQGQR